MKKMTKKVNKEMTPPTSLPFVEAVGKRLNQKVRQDNDRVLLAFYEKNWVLNGVVATIDGQEARYLRHLAKKHQSFIANKIF